MKNAAVLLLVLLAGTASAQNPDKLDELNGFLGVKFGTSIEALPDAVVDAEGVVDKIYKRQNQQLQWGNLKLREVRYRVFQGRIIGLSLVPASVRDSELLYTVLARAFGQGNVYAPTPDQKNATWESKRIRLTYAHDPANQLMEAEFVDMEQDATSKQAAAEMSGGGPFGNQ